MNITQDTMIVFYQKDILTDVMLFVSVTYTWIQNYNSKMFE